MTAAIPEYGRTSKGPKSSREPGSRVDHLVVTVFLVLRSAASIGSLWASLRTLWYSKTYVEANGKQ